MEKHPEYVEKGVLEMFVEPERVVQFRVPWVDDSGKVRVNRGFACSPTAPSVPTRAVCASTRR